MRQTHEMRQPTHDGRHNLLIFRFTSLPPIFLTFCFIEYIGMDMRVLKYVHRLSFGTDHLLLIILMCFLLALHYYYLMWPVKVRVVTRVLPYVVSEKDPTKSAKTKQDGYGRGDYSNYVSNILSHSQCLYYRTRCEYRRWCMQLYCFIAAPHVHTVRKKNFLEEARQATKSVAVVSTTDFEWAVHIYVLMSRTKTNS